MGGRKDLGGADPVAHGGTVQQVPAAQLLEQAAATQGTHNVPPGHDHSGYPGSSSSLEKAALVPYMCRGEHRSVDSLDGWESSSARACSNPTLGTKSAYMDWVAELTTRVA